MGYALEKRVYTLESVMLELADQVQPITMGGEYLEVLNANQLGLPEKMG